MQKPHRINPPRNILIHNQRGNQNQTGHMMNKQRLLTNGLSPINLILYQHIRDIEQDCKHEADAGEVVCGEFFIDWGVFEAGDHWDEEEGHHGDVAVVPDVVQAVVAGCQVHYVTLFYYTF